MAKSPDPIDVHVGSRVRMRRMMIGMSQERLAEQLKLSFQQIQKYEKGANRIGASRLFAIAQSLDVPVEYFFDGYGESANVSAVTGDAISDERITVLMDFVRSREGLELNKAFARIKDDKIRSAFVGFVRTLP